ncbi:GDSL-type esterase/lipase family protein [Paracoccus spongiarum]|uniref:GDSL-type esterase/lipase family protein n=1 Tax=Paracoccus spongiarum TaxID=3064387 RepID=A0ABT9J8P7_9RHOB|nr:GDSL-type esterase/lipase family protein [Paracoccus sp. 2205BS29-5]MDP5306189.1 GDSL-type esterase/lipase family protein [Paracoccus sp. 2205BS29-5]
MRAAVPIWSSLAASALLLAAGLWAAQPPRPFEGPVPPVSIAPDAPAGFAARFETGAAPASAMKMLPAHLTGRIAAPGDAGPGRNDVLHQWPGFHATARFEGTGFALSLDDDANRYRLVIDGTEVMLTRPGRGLLRVSGLADRPHLVRLEKLSETGKTARFGGFFLPPGARALAPPAPGRLIEFVGDSDTVGYGNTAPGRDCSGAAQFLATDTSRAYGPATAAALGADYRIVAASGIGLIRNMDGSGTGTMRDLYPTALPLQPDAPALPAPPADVIVIALGSNDFGTVPGLDEDRAARARLRDDFSAALLDFLRARRAEAPAARLVLLAFGEYGKDLVAAHRAARDAFVASGDRAELIVLPELARTGCHWHPSLNDHAIVALRLTSLLGAPPAAGRDRP